MTRALTTEAMIVPLPCANRLCFVAASLLWLLSGCGTAESPPNGAGLRVPTAPAVHDPLAERWDKLLEQLRAVNPEFQADQTGYRGEDDRLTMVEFDAAGLRDISPLAGLPLKFLSLKDCPVQDLSALRGMPLEELALEGTQVVDLSPLSQMPLRTLWLNGAPVEDLRPLRGLPLTSLNLLGTKVVDLSPLRGMPLESLWLNETAVVDLTPLAECPLVSLTLHRTPVSDISVVRQLPTLQRLHLGETRVTDLRPLAGLRLTRLIVTPQNITAGWDVVRRMDTLEELDVALRDGRRWSPAEFWDRFDQGAFPAPTPSTSTTPAVP
jgi:hypothetical protein